MGTVAIKLYETHCDGQGGDDCHLATSSAFLRSQCEGEAESTGWLRRGRKWYCPACRAAHEPKKK